jgi:hypothetical protein
MSMDSCYKCGTFVDTDMDCECYYSENEEGGECVCQNCREKANDPA